MALTGDLVRSDRTVPGYLGPLGEKEIKIIFEQCIPALSEKGVLGDPITATEERGEAYIEKISEFVVKELKKLL